MINVCVFGDSVAKGVVFDEEKKKYIFLGDNFLKLVQERQPVKFRNFAKFGCTVTKGSLIMSKQRNVLSDYDYTILEFGGNDCDFDWNSVSESPFDAHRPNITMDIFRNTYKSMIESVIASGSTPILLTLPPLDSNRFFGWISKGLDGGNIMSFLNNDVETIYNWHKIYNDMVRRLAAEYGIALIDIRKAFTDKKEYSNFLCADGMHPNANGHKLIAACVGNAVRGLAA